MNSKTISSFQYNEKEAKPSESESLFLKLIYTSTELAGYFSENLSNHNFKPALDINFNPLSSKCKDFYFMDLRTTMQEVCEYYEITGRKNLKLDTSQTFKHKNIYGVISYYPEDFKISMGLFSHDGKEQLGVLGFNLFEKKLSFYYYNEKNEASVIEIYKNESEVL